MKISIPPSTTCHTVLLKGVLLLKQTLNSMLFVLKQYHTAVLIEVVVLIEEILYASFTHHHLYVSFRGGGHVHFAHF